MEVTVNVPAGWDEPVHLPRVELRVREGLAADAPTIAVKAPVPAMPAAGPGTPLSLTLTLPLGESGGAAPRLWSPDDPFLYGLDVLLHGSDDSLQDSVCSYFGMRTIAIAPDVTGVPRLLLNGEPIFMNGPLDQGFWPDGIYTAPTEEALCYDIQATFDLGMNTIRKHVKVEPQRWYYECDKKGMLVWQDMPNADVGCMWSPDFPQDTAHSLELPWQVPQATHRFRRELTELIAMLKCHPSIVCWVPFNEGWGQHNTRGVTQWLRAADPTRLINSASGGCDPPPTGGSEGVGDIFDIHRAPAALCAVSPP